MPPPAILALRLAIAVGIATLGACAVGPDYVRPTVAIPAAYGEADPGWTDARPGLPEARDAWWNAFGDPVLADLLAQADGANQDIAQAEANVRAARAALAAARSGYFPQVGLSVGAQRGRTVARGVGTTANGHTASLAASWEPDLWGSVQRTVEAASADADASRATAAGVHLTVQAEVAQDYLDLRTNDALSALYRRTVDAYAKTLALTEAQLRAGTATGTDVALATSNLETARAQAKDLAATRAADEHAIAALVGRPPAGFTIAPARFDAMLPAIPVGVPSALLERRPDIANAERLAAAANANIGVAKAAYFPSLVLSASGGDSIASLGRWFTAPGRVWSLGASLAQTLFDGGLRRAHTDQAVAQYDAAVAQYRQTVLSGFQEVEDQLANLRVLADEQTSQDAAVAAARRAEDLAQAQFRAGTTTFLAVLTAQDQALAAERAAVTLRGRRYADSVALIRAIGGGWSASPDSTTSASR